MEKKKALAYKKFLIEAQEAFVYMMEQKSAILPAEIKKLKRKFNPESFEYAYSEFEEEIFENYKNYGDLSVIYSFLKTTFLEFLRWDKPDNVILDNSYFSVSY